MFYTEESFDNQVYIKGLSVYPLDLQGGHMIQGHCGQQEQQTTCSMYILRLTLWLTLVVDLVVDLGTTDKNSQGLNILSDL